MAKCELLILRRFHIYESVYNRELFFASSNLTNILILGVKVTSLKLHKIVCIGMHEYYN